MPTTRPVTSPNKTLGPRRYAVVSTPTRDLNRTDRSSAIMCEMAIYCSLLLRAHKYGIKTGTHARLETTSVAGSPLPQ